MTGYDFWQGLTTDWLLWVVFFLAFCAACFLAWSAIKTLEEYDDPQPWVRPKWQASRTYRRWEDDES